jgi:hypothetical protein
MHFLALQTDSIISLNCGRITYLDKQVDSMDLESDYYKACLVNSQGNM